MAYEQWLEITQKYPEIEIQATDHLKLNFTCKYDAYDDKISYKVALHLQGQPGLLLNFNQAPENFKKALSDCIAAAAGISDLEHRFSLIRELLSII